MNSEDFNQRQLALQVLIAQYQRLHTAHTVYEQRQTEVFNYTLVVYAAAIAAASFIVEKLVLPAVVWPPDPLKFSASILSTDIIYGVGLPALILPLCFLFLDSEIYATAIMRSQGPRLSGLFKEVAEEGLGLPYGEQLFRMSIGTPAMAWLKEKAHIDLGGITIYRMLIFTYAPLIGILVSSANLVWSLLPRYLDYFNAGMSVATLLVSAGFLYKTIYALRCSWRVKRVPASERTQDLKCQ